MTAARLHHVVVCVRLENLDRAADLWRDLGMTFEEIQLVEEGLRVLLDWSGGIMLIAPTERGGEAERFHTFLDAHGEGVYSLIVRTDDLEQRILAAARHGARVRATKHKENGEVVFDEADLEPVFGMAVTLQATNRPD